MEGTATMKDKHSAETADAIFYLKTIRCNALAEKRACAKPDNPFAPFPGMEKDFEEASKTVCYVNSILNELDKDRNSTQDKVTKSFIAGATDNLMFYTVIIGIAGMAGVGIVAISVALNTSPFVISGIAIAAALIQETWNRMKLKKPRKRF